ncbi:DUF177 domain-containing protein [Iodidimonas sp. SYSU 1G8]|uniref:YceD family protein n=1 Tax=Iodidimonas sp. SYSU 1G8 TaxID=3133967 RepID=UPI0031FF3B9F
MSEMHRPIDIGALTDSGRAIDFVASPEECAAIATRLEIVAVRDLRVLGRLDPVRKGATARFEARMTAAVTQRCVVSLDPVEADIDEMLHIRLVTEEQEQTSAELDLQPDEEDVEVVGAGLVDLGDICVQYLALALDPYPRRADLADTEVALPEEIAEDVSNPFAVLKKLKDKA